MNSALALMLTVSLQSAAIDDENTRLARHFGAFDGCFVVLNVIDGEAVRVNPNRCAERLSPCSTFKIPHALIALELGVVEDESTVMRWDGSAQPVESWQRDHTLASAIDNSVLWYFQRLAEQIGPQRTTQWLQKLDYGNADASSGQTTYWLQLEQPGSLRISADEQVTFLAKLYRDELPAAARRMKLVREMIVQQRGEDFTFSGKSGSAWADGEYVLGWYVGHVKRRDDEFVFALNIRGAGADGFRTARRIAETILRELAILPAQP